MIISSSSIGMDSVRTYTSVSKESSTVKSSISSFNDRLSAGFDSAAAAGDDSLSQNISESDDSDSTLADFSTYLSSMKAYAFSDAYENKLELDAINRIKTECIQYLLYILFGGSKGGGGLENALCTSDAQSSSGQALYSQTVSVSSEFYAEQEETSFSTNGTVITGDGRELSFNLDLSMSRSFAHYFEQQVSSVNIFTDPLVINLDVNAAQVSDVKISFDLDCDGENESISKLSSGSGYLALDLNDDGLINDGSELFGTRSGDGFSDLAEYDTDNNGWIDEADDVFSKLKITVFNEDGSQSLYSLKDKGVGAICLSSEDTEFSLNSLSTNETNAKIRKTGIFLYESGSAGTVQHLDLAR